MELIYLYIVFSYLVMLGLFMKLMAKEDEHHLSNSLGNLLIFIFSPIFMPLYIGTYMAEKM